MRAMRHAILVLSAVFSLFRSASADDLEPPPWRGLPGSTFQHWEFHTPPPAPYPPPFPPGVTTPMAPDGGVANPFGAPTMVADGVNPPATEWLGVFGTRAGVWRLDSTSDAARLIFEIPNADEPHRPKKIRVQITYFDVGVPPAVAIHSAAAVTLAGSVTTTLDDGWKHELTTWKLDKCPDREKIVITPAAPGPIYIDQVVIDTICWPPVHFRRGDSNGDATIDIGDAVFTLGCQFLGTRCPSCNDAADFNDDGAIDIGDAVATLAFMFLGGSPPPAPYPQCGADPTPDSLDCDEYPTNDAPCEPRSDIERALDNWNAVYGTNVTALGWTYAGRIESEVERTSVVADMTAPGAAWFPSGDVSRPREMTAMRLIDDAEVTEAATARWREMVDSRVRVGHHVVEIAWARGNDAFTSTAILDGSMIVYDSMLYNVVLTPDHLGALGGGGASKRRCLNYRMWWIWEGSDPRNWTRGRITADIVWACDKKGNLTKCEFDCSASMTLGDARINCKKKESGNCCEIEYSWAWATSFFKSIKLGTDGFTLEIEGSIGSSASANGSCEECCDGERTD